MRAPLTLSIVVASDASGDRTDELVAAIAAREPRVHLLPCPRGGKVAAQNRAVRATESELVAFSEREPVPVALSVFAASATVSPRLAGINKFTGLGATA